jgi:ribonuclease HII
MRIQVGIDEAGRGCWAGPLVAAAVLLHQPVKGLADSKKLSALQRKHLDMQIRASASYGMGWVSAQEIDAIGLTAATAQAMAAAVAGLDSTYDEIVIDGTYNYLPALANVRTLAKADALIPAVSAASIIAKVARDEYMMQAALDYPQYQFERHVGYGTALHHELLKMHGVCALHRLSYRPLQALLKGTGV